MQQQVIYPATGQQQVMSQQVVYTTATGPTGPRVYENYASGQSQVLGILQIIIGALCIIFQSVAIGLDSYAAAAGAGIWCGIFFILTGIFGVTAAKYKTTCHITTFMVLAIVGVAIFLIPIITVSSFGISFADSWGYIDYHRCDPAPIYDYRTYERTYPTAPPDCKQWKSSKIAMNAILLILALVELVVGIWSSAICCAAVCCGATPRTQGVVLNQGQTVQYMSAGGQPQVVIMTNHPGMNYGQPAGVHYQTTVAAGYPTSMPNTQVPGPPAYAPAGAPPTYQPEGYQPGPANPPQYAGQQQQQQQPQAYPQKY